MEKKTEVVHYVRDSNHTGMCIEIQTETGYFMSFLTQGWVFFVESTLLLKCENFLISPEMVARD